MSEKRQRNRVLVVRLNDEEYADLKRRANGNVSGYIRRAIFGTHRVTLTHPFNNFAVRFGFGDAHRPMPSNGYPHYSVGSGGN